MSQFKRWHPRSILAAKNSDVTVQATTIAGAVTLPLWWCLYTCA